MVCDCDWGQWTCDLTVFKWGPALQPFSISCYLLSSIGASSAKQQYESVCFQVNGAVTSNLFVTVQWLLKQLKLAKLTEEREFNIFTFKILSQSTSVNVIVATFDHHELGPVGALLQVTLIHASEMLRQHVRFFIMAMKYWIHYITYNVILKFEFQSQY